MPSNATNPTDTASLDKRVQASRERVLAAAFELLTENGVGGLTVDEVARRSGVAKTTIYRHWRDRSALVIDACSRITDEQEVPDTGSLEDDLKVIATTIATLLETARWAWIVPSIIDAAERDAELAAVHARIQRLHAAPLRGVVVRAVARDQLPVTADPDAIAAALLGPLFYRRWFSREPIDAAFIEILVRGVLAAAREERPPR